MMTIISILLSIIAILVTIIFYRLNVLSHKTLCVGTEKLKLYTNIVKNAINSVNQVSLNEEISSEEKKMLAIAISIRTSKNLGIQAPTAELLSDLIESVIWSEDEDEDEDEDEF